MNELVPYSRCGVAALKVTNHISALFPLGSAFRAADSQQNSLCAWLLFEFPHEEFNCPNKIENLHL